MAPTKPPDSGAGSGADISSEFCADAAGILVPIRGNNPTPVGVIAARWPRPACATAGCADIATATPNASAKAPARSMYLAAPNAVISCQSRKFTEFAPPSQGKEERRLENTSSPLPVFRLCRSARQCDIDNSSLVCKEKTGLAS